MLFTPPSLGIAVLQRATVTWCLIQTPSASPIGINTTFFIALVALIMFTIAFVVLQWGTSIVTAFSMTSHQSLAITLLPSTIKLTLDRDHLPVETADTLHIIQAFMSLQKQRLWSPKHACCFFMPLQAPVLRTPSLHSYLPKPVACGKSEHLLPSLGSKPPHDCCFRCSPCFPFFLSDTWHFPSVLFQPLCSTSFQPGGAKL